MTPQDSRLSNEETLSSNSLFHFASKREYLISILENNFAPRYYLEDLTMLGITKQDETMLEVAVPMVCFCDIPLSKMKYHLSCYGDYGIGMTKEWGIENGLSPILYADPKSETITFIKEILKIARHISNQGQESIDRLSMNIKRLMRFIKPYQGDFEHGGEMYPDKRFYDEREWRFVPVDAEPAFLLKQEFIDKQKQDDANSNLKSNHKLLFAPNDIEYIIVKTKAEVLSMIKEVMRIKEKYTNDEKMLLASKIISKEKIMSDF